MENYLYVNLKTNFKIHRKERALLVTSRQLEDNGDEVQFKPPKVPQEAGFTPI